MTTPNFEITAKTFEGKSFKLEGLTPKSTYDQLLQKVKLHF